MSVQPTLTSARLPEINGINYGFVMYKNKEVQIVDSVAKLSFVINLPAPSNLVTEQNYECVRDRSVLQHWLGRRLPITLRRVNLARNVSNCDPQTLLGIQFRSLFNHLSTELEQQILAIHDLLSNFDDEGAGRRTRRSWLPFIGRILTTVTGTANEDQIGMVRDSIDKLKLLLLNSTQVFTTGSKTIFSALKLESDRISNLGDLIRLNHQSITEIESEIRTVLNETDAIYKTIVYSVEKVSNFTVMLNDLHSFRLSIEALLGGKIHPDLISKTNLNRALNELHQHLVATDSPLRIIHQSLHFYYVKSHFMTFRSNNSIVVIIDCPLSLDPQPMNLLEFVKIPIHIRPASDKFFSVLYANFFGALFNPDNDRYAILDSPIPTSDNTLDPNNLRISFYSPLNLTCPLALLRRDVENIKSLCSYHIISDALTPQVLPISVNHFLLINISHASIQCGENVTSFDLELPQLVITAGCECKITADQFVVYNTDCNPFSDITNISTKYLINLPLLNQFFNDEVLSPFLPDLLLFNDTDLVLPRLKIADITFKNKIGIENSHRFRLAEIINRTLENQDSYGSLSQYILSSLMDVNSDLSPSGFSIFSIKDWILLASCVLSVISVIIIILLSCKLKNLTILVSALRSVKAQEIPRSLHYGISSTQFSPTTTDFLSTDVLQKIHLSVWLPAVSIVIALIVFGIFYYCCLRRKNNHDHKTTVFLEIGNAAERITFLWSKLPHEGQFYSFKIKQLTGNVTLKWVCGLLFGLTVDFTDICVSHRDLNFATQLTKCKIIGYLSARRVRSFLSSDYYVILKIVDCRDSEIVVLRNPFREFCPGLEQVDSQAKADTSVVTGTDPPVYPVPPVSAKTNIYPNLSSVTTG